MAFPDLPGLQAPSYRHEACTQHTPAWFARVVYSRAQLVYTARRAEQQQQSRQTQFWATMWHMPCHDVPCHMPCMQKLHCIALQVLLVSRCPALLQHCSHVCRRWCRACTAGLDVGWALGCCGVADRHVQPERSVLGQLAPWAARPKCLHVQASVNCRLYQCALGLLVQSVYHM